MTKTIKCWAVVKKNIAIEDSGYITLYFSKLDERIYKWVDEKIIPSPSPSLKDLKSENKA